MPLFMDRHDVPGATAQDVADAHVADLATAKDSDVKFISYWFDEENGGVFCFANAPSEEALADVHSRSHGLIPNEIIHVSEDDVFKFLGSVHEPKDASELTNPLRTIMFTDLVQSTEILDAVGESAFIDVLRTHDGIVREALYRNHGREVKHTGDGILASFDDASGAITASLSITASFVALNDAFTPAPSKGDLKLRVRVGMAAGRPVDRNDDIYGEAVVLASRLCGIAEAQQILATESVHEHAVQTDLFVGPSLRRLKGFAEPVAVYEVHSELDQGPRPATSTKPSWLRRIFGGS